jgi:hypothetical protein
VKDDRPEEAGDESEKNFAHEDVRCKPLTRPSATLSPLTRGEGSEIEILRPARSGEKVPRSGG